MSDLKPCPFCGGEPDIERMGTNKASMIIVCTDCGAKVECGATELHSANWNTRSNTVAMPEVTPKAVIEALKKVRLGHHETYYREIYQAIRKALSIEGE